MLIAGCVKALQTASSTFNPPKRIVFESVIENQATLQVLHILKIDDDLSVEKGEHSTINNTDYSFDEILDYFTCQGSLRHSVKDMVSFLKADHPTFIQSVSWDNVTYQLTFTLAEGKP